MKFGFGIQNNDVAQDLPALEQAGCDRIILVESPQLVRFKLEELIQYLRSGDILVIVDLDRLGRSVHEVVLATGRLEKAGVALRVEKREIIPGTPLGEMFSKACSCLSAFLPVDGPAEVVTQPSGKANARRRGRPAVLTIANKMKAQKLLLEQNASVPWVARLLNVSPATIYRHFPEAARSRFRRNGPTAKKHDALDSPG